MKLIPVAALVLLSSAVAQTTTLHEAQHATGSQAPQVTLCDLVAHPKDYAGKPVKVKATLASGMEYAIFTDDSCQPAPDKAKLILAKFSSSQFESPLGKKLSKLLKQKQRAEVTVVGIFTDPGRFIGHQACCRFKLEVQQLLGAEELKAKPDSASTDTVDPKTGSYIAGNIKEDEDYFPYGGEVKFVDNDPNHYKFTGKERDSESGLDDMGARYFGSGLGRFITPDAFYKDSHVADPQSWNEYAYARNNPLRYVDPTGENATVSTTCSTTNNQTTCNVNVSTSIAIYAQPGSNLTQDQLNQAASTIQSTIQNAWSGSFTQDGVTYNVSTQVSVQVAASEADASKTGAQNVVGLSNGPADHAHRADAETGPPLDAYFPQGPRRRNMELQHSRSRQ
jgi:RHS repeat-associated protein